MLPGHPRLCNATPWTTNSRLSSCKCLDPQITSYPTLWYLYRGLRDDRSHPRGSVWIHGHFAVGSRNATYGGPSRRGWPPTVIEVSSKSWQWWIQFDGSTVGSCQQLWDSDTYSTLAISTEKWTCGFMLVRFIDSALIFLISVLGTQHILCCSSRNFPCESLWL